MRPQPAVMNGSSAMVQSDGAGQVDAQHMLEAIERQRVDAGHVENGGVVDQDVQLAQLFTHQLGELLHGGLIADIDLSRDGDRTQRRQAQAPRQRRRTGRCRP